MDSSRSGVKDDEGSGNTVSDPDTNPGLPPGKTELDHRGHYHPAADGVNGMSWCYAEDKRINVEAVRDPAIQNTVNLRSCGEHRQPTKPRNSNASTSFFPLEREEDPRSACL